MLQHREPFHELDRLNHWMDRFFERGPWRFGPFLRSPLAAGELALDVYRTPEALVVEAPLPGVKPEEVNITLEGNTLSISGERKEKQERREQEYLLQEHSYGSFSRTITLPTGLDTDKAEASFENGVLTLTIPRAEKEKPRVVEVKAKKV